MATSTRLTQIENATLSQYENYDVATRRSDEKRGKSDGRANFPAADEEHHPFRNQLVSQARTHLKQYRSSLDAHLAQLCDRRDALKGRLEERIAVQREQLVERYQAARNEIERGIGPQSVKYASVSAALTQARDREQEIYAEVGRPLRIHLRWFFAPIMALVAVSEVPINRFAFELYFSESPLISLGISLVLGMVLAMFAHFVGMWLKRSTHYETLKSKLGHIAGVILILAIVLPTIYIIALLREHYVQFLERTSTSLRDLIQQDGIAAAVSEVGSTSLSTEGLTLLLLNIVVFSIGAIASFVRHDAHPDYEGVVRSHEKLKKRMTKLDQKHQAEIARVHKAHNTRIQALDASQNQAEEELEDVVQQIGQAETRLQTVPKHIASIIVQRLNAYEYANRRERTDRGRPRCFGSDERELMNELVAATDDINGGAANVSRIA